MGERSALVTGATGCLGRHLVGKLAQAGYAVRASGRNLRIGGALASDRVAFVAGDLSDAALIRRLVEGIDVVFHCAALSSPWGARRDFKIANVDHTRALLEAAQAAHCERLVHVSSSSIYFDFADRLGIREDDPLPRRFVNDYAATKAAAERVLRGARGDLAVTILRPRGIFGEYDGALAPRLLALARGGRCPVFRAGEAVVDVTYAGNVADAMLLCDRPDAPAGVFNITNGEPLAVHDLLARVFRALGREVRLVHAPYRLLHVVAGGWELVARALQLRGEPRLLRYPLGLMRYSQTLDISAAKAHLGYRPSVGIDQGLARYAAWLGSAAPEAGLP